LLNTFLETQGIAESHGVDKGREGMAPGLGLKKLRPQKDFNNMSVLRIKRGKNKKPRLNEAFFVITNYQAS
jgi:hypothetical protein